MVEKVLYIDNKDEHVRIGEPLGKCNSEKWPEPFVVDRIPKVEVSQGMIKAIIERGYSAILIGDDLQKENLNYSLTLVKALRGERYKGPIAILYDNKTAEIPAGKKRIIARKHPGAFDKSANLIFWHKVSGIGVNNEIPGLVDQIADRILNPPGRLKPGEMEIVR